MKYKGSIVSTRHQKNKIKVYLLVPVWIKKQSFSVHFAINPEPVIITAVSIPEDNSK